MSWVLFLAIGIFAALAANYLDSRRTRGGVTGAVLIGGAGALLGGVIANFILGQNLLTADLATFIIAMMASLLIILMHRTMYLK